MLSRALSTFCAGPLVMALLLPRPSWGQGLGVSAVVADARHALLSAPLVGGAAAVRWGPPGGRLRYHVAGEWLGGRAARTGVACAGLVLPGTCAPEPVRDEARLYGGEAGAALRVLGGGRVALALTGDLTAGAVRADTRGLASGRAVHAWKAVWGGRAGAEAHWVPAARVPVAVEVGAALGGVLPFTAGGVVDGYTPFDDGFGLRRLRVGLAWRGRAAHQ